LQYFPTYLWILTIFFGFFQGKMAKTHTKMTDLPHDDPSSESDGNGYEEFIKDVEDYILRFFMESGMGRPHIIIRKKQG